MREQKKRQRISIVERSFSHLHVVLAVSHVSLCYQCAWLMAPILVSSLGICIHVNFSFESDILSGTVMQGFYRTMLIFMLAFFFCLYVGLEVSYGGYVYSYAVKVCLSIPSIPSFFSMCCSVLRRWRQNKLFFGVRWTYASWWHNMTWHDMVWYLPHGAVLPSTILHLAGCPAHVCVLGSLCSRSSQCRASLPRPCSPHHDSLRPCWRHCQHRGSLLSPRKRFNRSFELILSVYYHLWQQVQFNSCFRLKQIVVNFQLLPIFCCFKRPFCGCSAACLDFLWRRSSLQVLISAWCLFLWRICIHHMVSHRKKSTHGLTTSDAHEWRLHRHEWAVTSCFCSL